MNILKKFLKKCLCLCFVGCYWESVLGSGASVQECTLARLGPSSRLCMASDPAP